MNPIIKTSANMLSRLIILSSLVLIITRGNAQQSLTLDDCILKANANYPLQNQQALWDQLQASQTENNRSLNYPQINIIGQATYQSEVTRIPNIIPNLEIPSADKDQYKLYTDLYQNIYNGGISKAKEKIQIAQIEVEKQKVNVEIYQVRQRVIQLYFGVVLAQEQLKQIKITESDIQNAKTKVTAAIKYGTASKNNLTILESEEIHLSQKKTELNYQIRINKAQLAKFIATEIDSNTLLILPSSKSELSVGLRPEQLLFEKQKSNFAAQSEMLKTKKMPKVGFFLQAGFGKPGLNFLDNSFRPYYLAGLRTQWTISDWYNLDHDKNIIRLQQSMVDQQDNTFKFNLDQQVLQSNLEYQKYQELIAQDEQIISLRKQIKETATIQLENGIITSTDFLKELNAEEFAREEMSVHIIRMHLLQYQLQFLQNGYPTN
ncbi:MAG: TolC family protein [Saprospiraceae bacterium]